MDIKELRHRIEGGLLSFPLTDLDGDDAFDAAGYRARLDWLAPYGAAALFPAGGAGEYFSLSDAEVDAVVSETVVWSNGTVPVVAAAGMGTNRAVAHAKAAEAAGADGILLLPPYMTEASQAGLFEHISRVCTSVGLGVLVYNRANCRLAPATVARLAASCPNMIGVKDGIGAVEWLLECRRLVGDRLLFVNGMPTAEIYAPSFKAMGAPTYSSAIFNFVPATAVAYHRAMASGDDATRDEILSRFLLPYLDIRARQPGYAVSIVKAGAEIVGRSAGHLRPPLSPLTANEHEALSQLIEAEGPQYPLAVDGSRA
jgi:5-dehydro-4-deoxyglucarate dehydratase